MRTRRRGKVPGGLCVLFCLGVLLVVIGWPAVVGAQQASAVVSAVTGRVEVLSKGQTAWQAARVGMRVFEGDGVRAFANANAELRLPDGTTLFVSENSRFVVTRLDFDSQNQMRAAFFHLAAGKLRAVVTRGAVARIQARQNNFAISTRTAVAAVSGTTVYASFDPTTNQATFLVTDGVAIIRDFCTGQLVTLTAGQVTTVSLATPCQPPTPPTPATPAQVAQITAAAQPASPDTATVLDAPTVVVVPADVVLVQILSPPAPTAPPAIIVTPAPAPPHDREVSPFQFR